MDYRGKVILNGGHSPDRSKPAEQNQDKHDKEYEAESATIVAGPIEGAAPEAAKAPE
jgi:hypothetical protein